VNELVLPLVLVSAGWIIVIMLIVLFFSSKNRPRTAPSPSEHDEDDTLVLIKTLIDSAPFVINLWDEGFNLISTSQHAAEMFGLGDKDDYIKMLAKLTPKYQPSGILSHELGDAMLTKAFSEGFARFEMMHNTLDGKPLPTEVTLVRFMQNNRLMVVGYAANMSAAKAAEERHLTHKKKKNEKETTERTKLMFDAAPLVIQYWDKNHTILECNKTTLDFYGFTSKTEYLKNLRSILIPTQPDGTSTWEKWGRFLNETFENGTASIDFVEPDQNGEPAFFECLGLRTKFNGDTVVITYSTNITKLNEVKSKLEEALKQATLTNEARNNLLAGMSHELKNPMNAIIGMISLGKATKEASKKDYAFEIIEAASTDLIQILNNVVDMARIESGRLKILPQQFELKPLVEKVVSLYKINAAQKKQVIITNLDRADITAFNDARRIEQVLSNILSNAIKFTPERGLITVGVQPIEDVIRFDISDTGIGITEKQKEHLFEIFQGENKKSSLGLVLCKHLIEQMGGKIWLTSEPRQGSIFSFIVKNPPS
jgi:signal transduction histidine kinase